MRPLEFVIGAVSIVACLFLLSLWASPAPPSVDREWINGNLQKNNDVDGGITQKKL